MLEITLHLCCSRLQNDGHVEFYPGNFTEYEADRKKRGVEVHYDPDQMGTFKRVA